jgi:hypothetical protein
MSEKITGDTDTIIRYMMEEKINKPEIVWDIAEHKEVKMRSNNANSYFYVLCNKIARKQKISDAEVHDRFLSANRVYYENADGGIDWKVSCIEPNAFGLIKERVGQYNEYYVDSNMVVTLQKESGDKVKYKDGKEVAGKVFWHIKGSHEMTSAEFSRLLDSVIYEAKNLDIEVLPPDEIKRMMTLWEEKHG